MARRQAPLESGERDSLVTIQQLTESVGDSGFPVETWATLCTMWAHKEDLSVTEQFKLNQISAPGTTRWEVNYREDLDPDLEDVVKKRRLVYQGRVYDITGASMIGRKEGVELYTLAKVG